jgi:4-amino-4-deoxy-L-arabinose transferase-like glycosyltransferase
MKPLASVDLFVSGMQTVLTLDRAPVETLPGGWQRAAPALVFLGTALFLWWTFGNRLILGTNDEGIYLDAAERILHGQKPYVDFFGVMTPGSFWIQALGFRLLGVTQIAGRAPVILFIALECALVYWLVERYASRGAAIVTSLFFLAFQTADPSMVTATHRWDSGALALASIAVCVAAQSVERRRWLLASGILIVCAALATPSVAMVGVVTLAWLAWPAGQRARAGWYLLGLSMALTVAGIALGLNGMLSALLRQLVWLSRNYSAVNVMHYGAIIGGYGALFQGASVWELPVQFCAVFCLALPAVLPIVAIVGGLRRVSPYLLLSVVALVASTYPRSDVAHLAYISALPYAVVGIFIYRWVPVRPRAWLVIFAGVWAAVFALQGQLPGRLVPLDTPVGNVRASAAEAPAVRELLSRVQPGQSLFVYPYRPLFYFLTQTENPTRYSYLQAGLMTNEDVGIALAELEARPPEWVLYMELNQAEFERVFPAGERFDSHYPQLESWIKANYRPTGFSPVGGYVLLRRAGDNIHHEAHSTLP